MTAASEAVRGNSGIFLTLKRDADPTPLPFDHDVKAFALEPEDKDDSDLTFAEAAAGETTVTSAVLTAIQSTAVGSFWRFLWENPGAEVAFVYGPHGNATPTASKPHFLGVIKLGGRPKIGTEATTAKDRADFETTVEVIDGPELDDGA